MLDMLDHPTAQQLVSDCNEPNTIDSTTTLQQAIAELSPEHPFASFDLGLPKDQIDLLNQIQISTEKYFYSLSIKCVDTSSCKTYSGYGDGVEHDVNFYITDFIKRLSVENERIVVPITQIIIKLIDNVVELQYQDRKPYRILLKAQSASASPDPYRWHMDGSPSEYRVNTVFAFKGSHTLFCPPEAVIYDPETDIHDASSLRLKSPCSCNTTEFINSTYGQGDVFFAATN